MVSMQSETTLSGFLADDTHAAPQPLGTWMTRWYAIYHDEPSA